MVTHLIWLMSVKHVAVDYPLAEYGAFTPLTPTKVYNDTRVPPETFAVFNLPHVNISVVSHSLSKYHTVISSVKFVITNNEIFTHYVRLKIDFTFTE